MYTTHMQIQALADRLAGLPAQAKAGDFCDPWKTCWLALEKAPPGQAQRLLVDAMAKFPDPECIIGAIAAARPGADLGEFPSLAQLACDLRPVEWVWPGWLPRSMITLLGAVPGAGKSFLSLDLARRVIHGKPFPDGAPAISKGGSVIYVDAEAVPQIINARVQAWKMDSGRLYLLLPDPGDLIDFSQSQYRDKLVEMAAQLQPELVIVDSLGSISSKGENNVEDVRQVLGFLNLLAQDFHTGLLLIHHLRKSSGVQPRLADLSIDDFRGSGHIIAMARSVIGLNVVQTEAEPDRNGPRKLEVIKNNLGAYPAPLGFTFTPLPISGAARSPGVYLQWGQAPKPYKEPTTLEKCQAWLEEVLKAEEMRPADLVELGKSEGFSRALIYRARDELGAVIENTQGRKHRANAWKWAGQAPEAAAQPF